MHLAAFNFRRRYYSRADTLSGAAAMTSNFARYPSLDGMPVVISGGASGIGETIVREFAAQGSKVGFVDIAGERGRSARRPNSSPPARPSSSPHCDITDIAAYQAAIARLRGGARPGAGAGQQRRQRHAPRWNEVTPEFWDKRIAVNLKHAFFAAQAVIARHDRGRAGARSSISARSAG